MSNTANMDTIKALRHFATSAEGFWSAYDEKVSDARCDKYEATFNGDSRWVVFKTKQPVQFNAHLGYYGNSSCSTFGSLNEELANRYFVCAINDLKREIFARMAVHAKADAAKLVSDAEAELDKLRRLLDSVKEAA